MKVLEATDTRALYLTTNPSEAEEGAIVQCGSMRVVAQEAAGPFAGMMSLPPVLLQELSAEVLQEFRDARGIFLVRGSLDRVGEDPHDAFEESSSLHGHALDRPGGSTLVDGPHRHAFRVEDEIDLGEGNVLAAGSIIITTEGGEHSHEFEGDRTGPGNPHVHGIVLPDGTTVETSEDTGHEHVVGLKATGCDGLHGHVLVLGGVELESLSPAALAEVMPSAADPEGLPEAPDPQEAAAASAT